MRPIEQFLSDMDEAVRRRDLPGRARAIGRMTDHLVEGGNDRSSDETAVLDQLMQRLLAMADLAARTEIAERLAPLASAPPGLIGRLALDEISVARPVLVASPVLTDQRLLDVVLARGREHHLALCERPVLSAVVTDLIVSRGDVPVLIAIAGHAGARLSACATATLLGYARNDEALGRALAGRRDLAPHERSRLGEATRADAARRLSAACSDLDVDALATVRGSEPGPSEESVALRHYGSALAALHGAGDHAIDEDDLAKAAEDGDLDRSIAAMAALTGLSFRGIGRLMADPQTNLPIVLGRARGWRWATVRAVLRLRDPRLVETHHLRGAQLLFADLPRRKAEGVIEAIRLRDRVDRNPLAV